MPRNPNKTPCQVPDCAAWAMRGSHPPLCASHAGRTTGAGAPNGNQNRRTHGFYAAALTRDELADQLAGAGVSTLDAEIACARIALHRVLTYLAAADPDLSPIDYARIASVVFHGARTVARLLRDNQALGGQLPNGVAGMIEIAMYELGQEWGIDLGPPPGPHAHPAGSSAILPDHRPTGQPTDQTATVHLPPRARHPPSHAGHPPSHAGHLPPRAGAPSPPRRLNLERSRPGEPNEPQ